MSVTKQDKPTSEDATELLRSIPEDLQSFCLAVSVVSKRIGSLPKEDQDDLFELVFLLGRAADETEKRSIYRAMVEILTSAKVSVRPMPLPHQENALPRGTEGWARFVGGRIRELRTKAGLTQEELASKAKLPQSHISRLENAEYCATNITLTRIARALGVEVGTIDPCAED
jgi:DNA-binding XRE family transcriptional regulator